MRVKLDSAQLNKSKKKKYTEKKTNIKAFTKYFGHPIAKTEF